MLRPFLLLSIVWGLIILALSLMPGRDLPDIEINYIDKIGHAAVYGILAFLIYKAGVSYKIATPILLCMIIPTVYGILMEWMQDLLSPDRIADLYDALANAFGAIIVGIAQVLRR